MFHFRHVLRALRNGPVAKPRSMVNIAIFDPWQRSLFPCRQTPGKEPPLPGNVWSWLTMPDNHWSNIVKHLVHLNSNRTCLRLATQYIMNIFSHQTMLNHIYRVAGVWKGLIPRPHQFIAGAFWWALTIYLYLIVSSPGGRHCKTPKSTITQACAWLQMSLPMSICSNICIRSVCMHYVLI